ncbi:MAG: polysaccharide deacetylase family protein [Colwellia sp.]|nr:polysaccharide deacetylase family protein [Colwellia sp.]
MKTYLLLLLLISLSTLVKSKEIAITFDDSPRSAKGYFDGPNRAKKLIQALKNHNIEQVAFFANSGRLDTEGMQRLQAYSQAGHIIANHTHSHPNFNKTSLEEYTENFLLADAQLSQFKGFKKLFRFPYLREGNSVQKQNGMREVLNKHGYKNAYITLNNYDWHIETLFQKAIKNGASLDQNRMRKFYVEVMIESIEYYDDMAKTHLGRSPKHILLLHEMDISALYIGDLVDELRRKGWKIISPEEAYTDEISQYQSVQPRSHNPGRIGEIARSKGQKKGLWHKTLDEEYLNKRFIEEVLKPELKK